MLDPDADRLGAGSVTTDYDLVCIICRATWHELWAVLDEVAFRVGTRSVDRVLLTRGIEIAVTEGPESSAIIDSSLTRWLILGIGLVEVLDVREFRAILAHEFSHFAQGESLLGVVAEILRKGLTRLARFFLACTLEGPATLPRSIRQWCCLHLLKMACAVSKHQELYADRCAARLFGSEALCDGLAHLFARHVELQSLDGRTSPLAGPDEDRPIGAATATTRSALSRGPFCTHPGPQERVDRLRRVSVGPPRGADASAGLQTRALIPRFERLRDEMNIARARILNHHDEGG
jgi:hypothetical protein